MSDKVCQSLDSVRQSDRTKTAKMVMTLSFCHNDFDLRPRPREALVVYGQSTAARTIPDDQGLDLLSFPREIRNNIYPLIFVKQTFIGSETKFTKPFYRDAIAWRNLAFAGSCRQIWNASLRLYLVQNWFEFFYIRPFLEFLERLASADVGCSRTSGGIITRNHGLPSSSDILGLAQPFRLLRSSQG